MPENNEQQINWKKNLFFVWLSQFFALTGFFFCMPFAAYYLQELGVTDKVQLKYYIGAFTAIAPLSLAVMSPVWGMLSDRYGRKVMMLRANFGAAIIIFLMGVVGSPVWLLVLRFLQGFFTGTVTAAQTLVTVSTPEDRHGIALGTLSAALFSGQMGGMFLGGYCAEEFGFAATFRIAGAMMLTSTFIILVFVKENFKPAEVAVVDVPQEEPSKRKFWRLPEIGAGLPLLVLIFATAFALQFDRPIIPLFVQELNDGLVKGSSRLTGQYGFVCGTGAILAGIISGRMVDKFSAPTVGKVSALLAAVFTASMFMVHNFTWFFIVSFCSSFCLCGIEPVFQVWLGRSTTKEKRGSAFGWAVTARATGWILAPISGTFLAAQLGVLRPIFLVKSILLLGLIYIIGQVTRRMLSSSE